MKFCLLTTFYPPWNFGGDGRQVQRLARALARRGHQVRVVHSREGFRSMSHTNPEAPAEELGIEIVAIDAERGRSSPLATYMTGRPLLVRSQLERALDGDYDVLHFHNPSLLGGPAILRMGDGLKLYTTHEQWLICPTHVLWQDRARVCEAPHCWRCTVRHGRPPQLWRSTSLMRDAVAQLDLLITPSATSAALHERFSEIVRIEHLAHFVEDPGEPQRDDGAATEPYILFAGRLEDIKGVQSLVEAARRWSRARVLIAGTGSLGSELRARSADLPHVEFLGWQSPRALDALYRRALATVVPSVGHEAFGLVPIESLARGVPSVVRDFGSLSELATMSEAVIGYRTNDELVLALDRLVDEPGDRVRLGEVARADYLAHWGEARHLTAYFALIAEVAQARGESGKAEMAAAASAGEPLLS